MRTLVIVAIIAVGIAAGSPWITSARGNLVISQYTETDTGSTPKGIEIWNASGATIDFSVTSLTVFQGTNGGALTSVPGATVNTGTLAANGVIVIGTSDIGTYLDSTFGTGVIPFASFTFVFNGDDALQIRLDGVAQDTFGAPGVDPGAAWIGGGVSTANQNIALQSGILVGDADGWSDPSERFLTVAVGSVLTGFGEAPAAIPEPTAFLFGGLVCGVIGLGACARRMLAARQSDG